MAVIKPFKAVRPAAQLAAQVASLPYDVMNSAEARIMAEGNPYSFLHVSRAEIDMPEGVDEHSSDVYQKAKANFDSLVKQQTLIQDNQPLLYIYAQVMNGRQQIGLVACSSVEDYFNNVIKKHELTRPEKEKDRIDHMLALQAHVGPIFLTYHAHPTVDGLINDFISANKPVYDFTATDGIQHTVWVINDKSVIEKLVSLFKTEIPFTYIADGHHRTASAAKVGQAMRAQNPNHTGQEEYNFFLSVLFPHNQLAILDYNRLVKDLNGLTEDGFLQKISEKFSVEPLKNETEAKPGKLHDFGMYLNSQWYRLTAKPGTFTTGPIGILDISILQDNLLTPVLGINDPRTDKRIDFVGGIRGLKELQRRVDSGEMKVAFALYPVSLQQLMDIADTGNIMPPKSTWFEPKLRDGLFSHLF
ncbi:MAG TPA: DUF1015 family protein [Chitinophagales bacterium]|nr:DUF1015 family protein [Chitinophagales bacterium]